MSRWSLVYEGFDPEKEGLREALCTLGNGFFCTRGAGEESEADDVHYPGTYLAGGYNRLATEIAGEIVENEDLVNLPNWLPLAFRFGDGNDWIDWRDVEILAYRQDLDLRGGLLRREVRFRDAGKRITKVVSRRLVHMSRPHLAALETTVEAENWSGALEFRTALDGGVVNRGVARYRALNGRHLDPVLSGFFSTAGGAQEDAMSLLVRTNQSRLEIGLAARTRFFRGGERLDAERRAVEVPTGYVGQLVTAEVAPDHPVTVEKIVALYTSRDPAVTEASLEARTAVARSEGFDELLASHRIAWNHLWHRFDMAFSERDAERGEDAARILHLHIFHLLQTVSLETIEMDLDAGVPSRGWHGEAYRGHILWDELFIFPFLNLRLPEITRNLLMYRYRRLDEAREAARRAALRGAMFPWQSGSNGREESQKLHLNPRSGRWIPDNSSLQRHVNAAIAYNAYQYYQVTRDTEHLSFFGAEMILEIARFWSSIAERNPKTGRYEIRGVMGPDEYHEAVPWEDEPGLANNAYTNVMAVWVLLRARELLEQLPEDVSHHLREKLALTDEELELWDAITRRMTIPFHGEGIISQFEGYERLEEFDWDGYRRTYGDIQRLDRILEAENDSTNRYKVSKQADVLMLFYLLSTEELAEIFHRLGYDFDGATIPRNVDYYLARTSHGSTLSWVVHAWVLARRDRARSWKLFRRALHSDIADIQGGTTPEGIHLGAMAGSVDLLQRGYTGIVTRNDVLWFEPCLPADISDLRMQIRYRGYTLEVRVTTERIAIRALRAREHSITVGYRDRTVDLVGETSAEFTLDDRVCEETEAP